MDEKHFNELLGAIRSLPKCQYDRLISELIVRMDRDDKILSDEEIQMLNQIFKNLS